ncbi:MAG: LLM class flavin-dependent oxidoreductase [Ilumatobacteraceae bacterium]
MSVGVGLRLPPCRNVAEMASAARRAEQLGFDSVWFPDSQLLWRDVYATLAVAAASTERVTLGTAVTNVDTRHPSVLASAIRTVQEVAPERFVLGVGAGDSALRPIGLRPTPGRRLRAQLDVVRTLLRGDEVDFGGGLLRLRDAVGPCPVYLAANGPRNLALAGAIADGVIMLSGASTAAAGRGLASVHAGAREAGRDPGTLAVAVSAFAMITDHLERDSRLVKPVVATIAQTGGSKLLALAGISVSVPSRVPEVYPDLIHAEAWAEAVDHCGKWVSDDDALAFARTFCLFGTAEEIVGRITAIAAAGATKVLVQHVGSYDLPIDLMEAFGSDVLARLAP